MSMLKSAFIILAVASIASSSIGPHFDFPPAPVGFAAPLPPPLLPAPVFHSPPPAPLWSPPPAPLWSAPLLPAPAPIWPVPAPVSYYPAPAPAPLLPAPLPLPVPLPLTRPLPPPVFDPLPFAPAFRAIPGPVVKSQHYSLGFAHPVQVAKVVAAPAPHVHPVKLIAQPSHAHIHAHAHSAQLINLPHHHHHVIA